MVLGALGKPMSFGQGQRGGGRIRGLQEAPGPGGSVLESRVVQ